MKNKTLDKYCFFIFQGKDIAKNIESFLKELHKEETIDTTTMIRWYVDNDKDTFLPSYQ